MLFALALGCLLLRADPALAGDAAKWPAEGKSVKQDAKLKVDISNVSEGYFLARTAKETSKRLKLQVTIGKTTLYYDLPGNGDYVVIPLQMGSGKYKTQLYENVKGKKYASVGKITVKASLTREDGAFLYPNQYVDYNEATKAVAKADELCSGKNEQKSFDAVCGFMRTFTYDFVKAMNITAGILPDIEGSWDKQMGVCQDLSAIMCCMLRTQGIPCRLIIGYANKNYHAWTLATVDGKEVFYDPTAELGGWGKNVKYTTERFY